MTDPTSLPNFSPQPAGPPNGAANASPVRDRIITVLQGLEVSAVGLSTQARPWNRS